MEAAKAISNNANASPAALSSIVDPEKGKLQLKEGSEKIGTEPPRLFFQPKLTIGRPDDVYEKEADAMTDKVMRMEIPGNFSYSNSTVNRKCAECEKEEELQRKENEAEGSYEVSPIVYNTLNSTGGKPLDENARSFMEPRFNYDFSNVKIHDTETAAKSAQSINALAYTYNNNIVFNSGQYDPGSDPGKRLLAHELTHVVQQNGMVSSFVQREESPEQSDELSSPNQSIMRIRRIGPAIRMDIETGKALVREYNRKLADVATRIIPLPEDTPIAANESIDGEEGIVQTFPDVHGTQPNIIQRSSSGGAVEWEGGVVGSLQVCFNFCSGEVRVIGWIWAGAGIETRFGWYGAYAFGEKEFYRGNPNIGHINCGTCSPECTKEDKEGAGHFGGGIAGFPVVIRPGEKASLKQAGLEIGFLLTPHSCDADLEIIALLNLIQYAGPLGAAVSKFADAANVIANKFGTKVECQLGIDVSGMVHLCKSVPGGGVMGITADSAEICGGAFVACGLGLNHDKNALPH